MTLYAGKNWAPFNGRKMLNPPSTDAMPPGLAIVLRMYKHVGGRLRLSIQLPNTDLNGGPLTGLSQLAVCSAGLEDSFVESPFELVRDRRDLVDDAVAGKIEGIRTDVVIPLAGMQPGQIVEVEINPHDKPIVHVMAACTD